MKRLLLLFSTALMLFSGCSEAYDDSEIVGRLDDLEEEVNNLREEVENSKILLNALANNLTITSVKETSEGYIITFSDNSTITLRHGKDGEDGKDGADGEDGKDGEDGVDGEDGSDGEDGKDGEDGDNLIASITINEDSVTFELTNGQTVTIALNSGATTPEDDENIPTDGNPLANLTCASNEILYTTKYGLPIELGNTSGFGGNLVYNTYENGIGRLTFGNDVTAIPDNAFKDCNSMEYIKYPDAVGAIGKCAFQNCSSLTSITIPDSVTFIGGYAFHYCTSLASVTIGKGVTAIWDYAFNGCTSLAEVYCKPTTPPTGGSGMFYNNSSERKIYVPTESVNAYKSAKYWSNYADALIPYDFEKDEIMIPESWKIYYTSNDGEVVTPFWEIDEEGNSVFGAHIIRNEYIDGKGYIWFNAPITSIGMGAFELCSSLESITIPGGVTKIANHAFAYCSSLASITIPDSVTSIGEKAFLCCTSLTSITIPDSVTSIGSYAFCDCLSLTDLTIGNGVAAIHDYAFLRCTNLTNISIPYSVTHLGCGAFGDCSSIEHISIPQSLQTMGDEVFGGCSNLAEFDGKYASDDKRCLIVEGVLNSFAPANLTEYTVPSNVHTIGLGAFGYCTNLTSITLPDNLSSIGYGAFYGCSSLCDITIPNSVTEIGSSAFRGCTSLTSITIPDSVTKIGENAFWSCTSLTSVYCKATTPPTGGEDMFSYYINGKYVPIGCTIYVPTKSVDAYKKASYWSDYAEYIEPYQF